MTYRQRISFFLIIDSFLLLAAFAVSNFLTADYTEINPALLLTCSIFLVCHYLFFFKYNLYRKVWQYASIRELLSIMKAACFSLSVAVLAQIIFMQEFQTRFLITTWLLHIFLIGASRYAWRIRGDSMAGNSTSNVRTLIIGAGSAGTMVARQLLGNHDSSLEPVAFIDDDPRKKQMDILGLPVVGGVEDIVRAVKELEISNIIIAIPSMGRKELNKVFQECTKTEAKTKILPYLEDLITGKVSVNQFRDVQVEDLLGRDPIHMDIGSVSGYVTNKVVLVTGAGGSIGSELSRQISAFHPSLLILLGHGENSIYAIEMELREKYPLSRTEFITEIADIQDARKMQHVMRKYRPDVVYHAAAHKHVPLMERNPEEAVKNNIIGTSNVARAASRHGVGIFVMISTDKAVNPTSVMGASKRLTEMIIQDMDRRSNTRFVAVRFGNVLGSRGSVIPRFEKQIRNGGPVTVTHPDMVRYFMTIPEATSLVIQAGALAGGGEIFVLDMGEPVKIVDLAKNLIRLSGNSEEDIGIEFTGMRPGEKLFEELLKENEIQEEQIYPKIYIGKATEIFMDAINDIMANYGSMDNESLRERLLAIANHNVTNNVTNNVERKMITI